MEAGLSYIGAFLVGLMGSVHCVGMCGGIVGALTIGLPAEVRHNPRRLLPYLLAYNSGRIASYTLAGMLAGLLGAQFTRIFDPAWVLEVGRVVMALFMIALGGYLTGWLPLLVGLERIGSRVWRYLEPFGRYALPVNRPRRALALGLVWGWLPCGMVYALLAWSLASTDPLRGAGLMAAFGLGTLPMLLLMGTAAQRLLRLSQTPWLRTAVGLLLIGAGAYSLVVLFTTDVAVHQHLH